ncbi:MAG TPA: hypothetical protein VMD91_03850 [Candidatus Sulfotelmatobacter sp.]|nr:hypothetical protein [Candidatus Sulfotelmatobacter sp.]
MLRRVRAALIVGVLVVAHIEGLALPAVPASAAGQLILNFLPTRRSAAATYQRLGRGGSVLEEGRDSIMVAARNHPERWLEVTMSDTSVGLIIPHGYGHVRPYPEPCPGADFEHVLSPDGRLGACLVGVYHRRVPAMANGPSLVLFAPPTGRVLRRARTDELDAGWQALAFVGDHALVALEFDARCAGISDSGEERGVPVLFSLALRVQKRYTDRCATGVVPYGAGRFATVWFLGGDGLFRLADGTLHQGDLLAVSDDGTPIVWSSNVVRGDGWTVPATTFPLATWVR